MTAEPVVIASLVVGAETTRLSSTMANRLRSPCRVASREVTLPNLFAPSPEKVRLTCQPPVVNPCELVWSPAVAPVTSVPISSAGPSRYFSEPSSAQVMNGLFGSWVDRRSFSRTLGSEQSVWVNCCSIWAVTQFVSLASVGFAEGEAAGDGVAAAVDPPPACGEAVGVAALSACGMFMPLLELDGDAFAVWLAFGDDVALGLVVGLLDDPDADGDGVPVAVGAGSAVCCATSTARNCSCADCLTSWIVFWSGVPGRSTMILVSAP